MDFNQYKYFYVNGCSHSEGGGLEEPSIRDNGYMSLYEKKYNVKWTSRSEINYAQRLSEIIGIPNINESKSGASTERVVRMTYEFIHNNWLDKDKFFIILEKPDASRSEVFLNEEKDYFIVNSQYSKNKNLSFQYATRNYFDKKIKGVDEKYQNIFNDWFNHFYNFNHNLKKNDFDFIGLYSFCKKNDIKIYIMNTNDYYFNETFEKEDVISFNNKNVNDSIYDWCVKNKLTISDELGDGVMDLHPGYFGHIEYAKQLSKFLGYQINMNII